MQFTEEFLHYIWQFRLLTQLELCCTDGEALQILHPGTYNHHAGPDFSTAKLIIGGQLWVGNVEIHLKSSDWLLHQHQTNYSYDTVILHAVYEDDRPVYRTDGSLIPVLSLKRLIPEELFNKYRDLMDARNFFPCEKQIGAVDRQFVQKMLDLMVADRFHEKSVEIDRKMEQNNNNWNQTFYEILLRNFGFKVNAVPFELLAGSLSHHILTRHRDHPLQIAALLFGQAGFLEEEFKDPYPQQLKAEYGFLKKKYQLQQGDKSVWKFLRMHPQNFPVLRIAQLAGLMTGSINIFSSILESAELKHLVRIFSAASVHPYWKDHSHFDHKSHKMAIQMGRTSIENVVINTVCLMLYCFGKYFERPDLQERAIVLLEKMPAERNSVTAQYRKAGVTIKSAYDSQAILQLNKSYCTQKRCLHCAIGSSIISPACS